jgi:ABC-type uncharacterized transport system permease subunit
LRPQRQTDRAFGFTFAGVFAAIAVVGFVLFGATWVWSLALAAGFLLLGLLRPGLLRPLNAAWRWFAGQVGRLNSTIVLALLFYVVLTPVGLLLRLLAGDPMLRRVRQPQGSYFTPVRRQVTRETLADQF